MFQHKLVSTILLVEVVFFHGGFTPGCGEEGGSSHLFILISKTKTKIGKGFLALSGVVVSHSQEKKL